MLCNRSEQSATLAYQPSSQSLGHGPLPWQQLPWWQQLEETDGAGADCAIHLEFQQHAGRARRPYLHGVCSVWSVCVCVCVGGGGGGGGV